MIRLPFALSLMAGWLLLTAAAVHGDTPPQQQAYGATDAPVETLDQVLGVPGYPTQSTHYPWKKNVRAAVFSLDSMSHDVDLFYVALPFDDLAHPDLAQKWVPKHWVWPATSGGKLVSNCKGQWVEIKDAHGDTAYAQWEGLGLVNSGDADYVFGTSSPNAKLGLKISPAVAHYFSRFQSTGPGDFQLSWRFVDTVDVPPGYWLKYEEQAILFPAMREADAAGKTGDKSSPPSLTPSSTEADYRAAYLQAYLSINSAEHSEKNGKFTEARDGFIKAQHEMQSIAVTAPRWETALLIKRLEDLHSKVDELNTKLAVNGQ